MRYSRCCPNVSAINGYGLRGGKKNRFSNLTREDIQAQCAASHLPAPPLVATNAENAAYSDCVSTKIRERDEGRLTTYMSIGDWVASFFGRGPGRRPDDTPSPDNGDPGTGSSNLLMWLGLFILLAILSIVGYLIFRKK